LLLVPILSVDFLEPKRQEATEIHKRERSSSPASSDVITTKLTTNTLGSRSYFNLWS